jgi:Domain of unknown function (DUF4062)
VARPRIFISSTYYDLKHIRSSIERFVESLGFDAILSEKGEIAYASDVPLDESCYREVRNCDIFVLVIGGRYGSERSGSSHTGAREFFDRYDSVTKLEYKAAVTGDIPIYIFIEKGVNAEYQTFLRNKSKTDISYAHVDSVNVFLLIEEILAQPRNNPIKEFGRYQDIEEWLREQWAGLFKDHLQKASEHRQIKTLQGQVETLTGITNALKAYLENLVHKVLPQQAAALITDQEHKLESLRIELAIKDNNFVDWCERRFGISNEVVSVGIRSAATFDDLVNELAHEIKEGDVDDFRDTIMNNFHAQTDINEIRQAFSLAELPFTAKQSVEAPAARRRPARRPRPKVVTDSPDLG